MQSWIVWCVMAAEGSKVPQCAHFGCTDISMIHVAYFTHCIIFFQIKFHFTGLETSLISSVILFKLLNTPPMKENTVLRSSHIFIPLQCLTSREF